MNAAGGFAESRSSRARKVFDASDLPAEVAVLAEPLACAVHGMDVLSLRPGSDVLMLGSGTTEALAAARCPATAVRARVTVAAPTAFKLDLALAYGVDRGADLAGRPAPSYLRRLQDLALTVSTS